MDAFYIPWMMSSRIEDCSTIKKSLEGSQQTFVPTTAPGVVAVIPQYKLTFFPAKGMAEHIRLILAYGGAAFIDNRIGFTEWEKRKQEVPFQQMPFLEFDGKILCQSAAIARYLAKQYGLAGADAFEQAQADAVVDLLKECGSAFKPFVNTIVKAFADLPLEMDNLTPNEAITRFLIPAVDRFMPLIEQLAAENTSNDWLFKSGLTYADIALAAFFEPIEALMPVQAAKFKRIKQIKDIVFALPQLQRYLSERPDSIL